VTKFQTGLLFIGVGEWEILTHCIGVVYRSGATGVMEEVDGGNKLLVGNDTVTFYLLLLHFHIESLVLASALWCIIIFV
jgi:hypothetical protein